MTLHSIKTIAFSFTPFIWRRPYYEKTVLETSMWAGPLSIYWINA